MNAPLRIGELCRELRFGRVTSVDLVSQCLTRIDDADVVLHAFTYIDRDRAIAEAEHSDKAREAGVDLGPLHGIPYAVKDIFDVAGMPTLCGSRVSDGAARARDARVVELLAAAGAVLIGKTTTHEFALGGPSFELPFPPARNPYDTSRFSGGSSSGSAVAVAAGMVPLAIGSDTTGSIRGPASYCGITGLKPTFGLVSRRGSFPLSYSLDHVGPLTWDVTGAALALAAMSAFDPEDFGSSESEKVDYTNDLNGGLRGVRIGYAREFFAEDATPALLAAIDALIEAIARAGADIEEVKLPPFESFSACGRILMTAEAFAIHENDLTHTPDRYGYYTYQRLLPGAAITAADYIHAQRRRSQLTRIVNSGAFPAFDALITGSTMGPAPLLSTFGSVHPAYSTMRTVPFTVTGNPAIVLPVSYDGQGLPQAVQLVGQLFGEAMLLRIARGVEGLCAPRRPPEL